MRLRDLKESRDWPPELSGMYEVADYLSQWTENEAEVDPWQIESLLGAECRLRLERIPTSDIKPARDQEHHERIPRRLKKYAKMNPENMPPVLINPDGTLIDGHHRWETARSLKLPMMLAYRLIPETLGESSDFSSWFGNSKVVDRRGKPLVVYRGDFPNRTEFRDKENIFFTNKPEIGKRYIRNDNLRQSMGNHYERDADDPRWWNRVEPNRSHGFYQCWLSLQNPLIVDADNSGWMEIPIPANLRRKIKSDVIQIDYLAHWARKTGYDGLIVHNVIDQHGDGNQYVAFNPNQVRMI